jgi:hypothetical protein
MPTIPIPTEFEEQKALVQWLELKKWKFSAIPNSTYTKSWSQKAKNKASGLRAGLPDLLIVVKARSGDILTFCELKRVKNSKTSPEQEVWVQTLLGCQGVQAAVCKGFDEAKLFLEMIEKQ